MKKKTPKSPPPAGTVEMASLEEAVATSSLPAIVAGAFERLNIRLRARMLGRLLPSVGPLAMAAIAGGAFAKYITHARWPEIPVSFEDGARATSAQVYELVRYVQQSNPHFVNQMMDLLTRDTTTIAALGASVTALAITRLTDRRQAPEAPAG